MFRFNLKMIENNSSNEENQDNDNREDYQNFRILYDRIHTSKIPVVITEPEYPFRIIYINEAWKDLSGYSIEELYQRSIYYIRIMKLNNLIINKKKNGILFEHEFEVTDIPSLNLKIGITKKVKKINLNQYHLLNKYIYNDLRIKSIC